MVNFISKIISKDAMSLAQNPTRIWVVLMLVNMVHHEKNERSLLDGHIFSKITVNQTVTALIWSVIRDERFRLVFCGPEQRETDLTSRVLGSTLSLVIPPFVFQFV